MGQSQDTNDKTADQEPQHKTQYLLAPEDKLLVRAALLIRKAAFTTEAATSQADATATEIENYIRQKYAKSPGDLEA